ncbi:MULTISPECIES: hypothetical protein [Protofrankia]|uniref:Uncharacterized protein n=1 Tax=Candidatus Protofrankia datiscae TaxID=2716812 RepID=F8AZA1_9ACTN|nr:MULTISPECIES: hypothetical protein [Protofrankia]AEH11630.1 hypothetical protein FsymDg_4377 [Candidatus Protofrankia datiscae]
MAGERTAVREAVVRDALHAAVAPVDPPVPAGAPVRPVPRRESATVASETGTGTDAEGGVGVSLPARMASALRAAAELVELVGERASLHVTVSDVYPDQVVALVPARWRVDASAGERDAVRWADLRAVARLLGRPPAVRHDLGDEDLTVEVSATVAGSPVRVWAPLSDPDVIGQARALVAGMETGQ